MIVSLVFAAVCPSVYTLAVLFTLLPVSIVFFAVCPSEYTLAVFFTFLPVSIVSVSIGEHINTRAVSFMFFILAFVVIAVGEDISSVYEFATAPIAFNDVFVFLDFNSSTISLVILIILTRIRYAG